MKIPLLMTPGPTMIHESVRNAMAKEITNPDLDDQFFDYYQETCEKLKQLFHTKNDILILNGEGILGLEASCASLIEPGDKVLCIDNGIFGHGFGDFAKIYGAEVTYFKSDYRKAVSVDELRGFLEINHDYKIATLVHCETPSGITNPVDQLCPIFQQYGIITVVDAVSALGGEEVKVDEWGIDLVLAGSQKCLSAAPGLSILSISQKAWDKICNRTVPIAGFYCNLHIWKDWYKNKEFPYTQPISNIYGLREALDRVAKDDQVLSRHKEIAKATRASLSKAGLELYAQYGQANTVTAIMVPEGASYEEILSSMVEDHNIMIAGAFDILEGQVLRIGHMGENCYKDKVYVTLKALDKVLRKLGVKLQCEIHEEFIGCLRRKYIS